MSAGHRASVSVEQRPTVKELHHGLLFIVAHLKAAQFRNERAFQRKVLGKHVFKRLGPSGVFGEGRSPSLAVAAIDSQGAEFLGGFPMTSRIVV